MGVANRMKGLLHSAKTWVVLAILAPVGMLAVSAALLVEMRHDAWEKAEQTSQNLLQLIERDIVRNFEIIDLSLQSVIDNLGAPGVLEAKADLRQRILFDRAAIARDVGVLLVLDETGEAIFDAAGYPARKLNNADRDYFQAHKASPDLGLHISRPIVSKLTGAQIIVLSRRIDKPDGSFGGVVLASLRLSYFHHLFDRVGLGQEGAINLYLKSGVRIMRQPYVDADIGADIAGSSNFTQFTSARAGGFVAASVRDGVERLYIFSQVGELPLILNVAFGTHDIEAEWRGKAIVIGVVMFVLCGLTTCMALMFGQELRRRSEMQAELARLSRTDVLTGLPNRRHFDAELTRTFEEAARWERPLSLLMIDADHFKRVNDRFGHAVGDEVLKGLAGCLAASVHRPGDLVARIGGEEFAMVLADTDEAGAQWVAEKIHTAVAGLMVSAAGIAPGGITVSIGLSSVAPGGGARTSREELCRLADVALYEAKEGGRNQTRASAPAGAIPAKRFRVIDSKTTG